MSKTMLRRAVGVTAASLAAVGSVLCLSGAALASEPTGEYKPFSNCPYENTAVKQCILSESTSGEVILGNSRAPIVNKITLTGGTTRAAGVESFVAAGKGETLSKTAEPVEGGLLDLIPKTDLPEWLWSTYEFFFENGLDGVNAVTELAKPASEIGISASNLSAEEGVALKLPVRIHLENPFLGSECYIGSSSTPVYFSLTTGSTEPAAPNKSIKGTAGELSLNEGATILTSTGYKLVDNAFAAPEATGCGGLFSFIINKIVNEKIALPNTDGHNTAILGGDLKRGYAPAVRESVK